MIVSEKIHALFRGRGRVLSKLLLFLIVVFFHTSVEIAAEHITQKASSGADQPANVVEIEIGQLSSPQNKWEPRIMVDEEEYDPCTVSAETAIYGGIDVEFIVRPSLLLARDIQIIEDAVLRAYTTSASQSCQYGYRILESAQIDQSKIPFASADVQKVIFHVELDGRCRGCLTDTRMLSAPGGIRAPRRALLSLDKIQRDNSLFPTSKSLRPDIKSTSRLPSEDYHKTTRKRKLQERDVQMPELIQSRCVCPPPSQEVFAMVLKGNINRLVENGVLVSMGVNSAGNAESDSLSRRPPSLSIIGRPFLGENESSGKEPTLSPTPTPVCREKQCCSSDDCTTETEICFPFSSTCIDEGRLRFTLFWEGDDDLDLYVETPGGAVLSFRNQVDSVTGGEFGEDSNQLEFDSHAENVSFPSGTTEGIYRFYQIPFELRGAEDVWTINVYVGGRVRFIVSGTGLSDTFEFEYTQS